MPGKVSTEVDARFSFDTKGTVDKALHIIEVFSPGSPSMEDHGIELTIYVHSSTNQLASTNPAS